MKRSEIGELTCSLAGALSEVGDPWSFLIIKELMLGNRRFDGIVAQTGISESSLALRLKRLEQAGILHRCAYQERPQRYEYRLSVKGLELWPVLVTLTGWGDRWQKRKTPPLAFRCKTCFETALPTLACGCCRAPLNARSVSLIKSKDMQIDRAQRGAAEQQT